MDYQQLKALDKALRGYQPQPRFEMGVIHVFEHEDDQRQAVVDMRTGKILKRFRDTETAWSDAERFASDKFFEIQRAN